VLFAAPALLTAALATGLWRCDRAKPVATIAPTDPSPSVPTAPDSSAPEPAASKPQRRARRPAATAVPRVDPYQGDPAAKAPQTWSYQVAPRRGPSGLSEAVQSGDRHSLRELLDRGTPPNVPDGQTSPLHQAVHLGDRESVLMLLQKGANPNARNPNGETPLHEAMRRHDHGMVSNLLDFGANPNLPDRYGLRPLQVAGYDGTLLRKLREKGAN
jgi:hypothetical protein